MPWQDLTQARHTKLYNAIPPFATGLPLLSYSHTTFQNNHILPQHDENNSRLHHRGGCFHLFDKLEFVNTYYHKDIYLKFSFVFPNIL